MRNNLENIPACLRIIARQIEKGEIEADVGLLTLRKKGASRPVVFGFGAKIEPGRECDRAAAEVARLSGADVQFADPLRWHEAPTSTKWGAGMVGADIEVTKDSTATVYCEKQDAERVAAMFRPFVVRQTA
jgi:hypothetical protein